jgi:hypothetical protein
MPNTKHPSQLTTAELREQAEADGLRYYQQQLATDPSNPQFQYELECYCNQRGIRMNAEVNRLYDLPKEKLAQEWEARGKAVDEAELESYREKQAKVWMASQPGYTPSPEAAQKIVALVNKMGMQGSVADLQMAFDILCEKGELEAPAQPVPVYTREELSQMSAADCRRALEEMGFNTY